MSQVCYVQNLITFSKYRVRPECKLKGKAKRKVPGWWGGRLKARLLEMISLRMCYRWRQSFPCLTSQHTLLLQARMTASKIEINLYFFLNFCSNAE